MSDEKDLHTNSYSPTENEGILAMADRDGTEEKTIKRRKLDWILMPLLVFGLFCLRESVKAAYTSQANETRTR